MKKLFKNKIFLVSAAIFIIGGGYLGYRIINGSGTATTQYITTQVQKGTLVVSVSGSGQVSASNQTSIQAQNSGIAVSIPVKNNQQVKAGQLLVQLDTTNDNRAVRNAQTSLEIAKLNLENLQQPVTTSTLLQSQQSVVQAQQSLITTSNNLTTDYSNAYTDMSNTFIDLPGVMTGLNNVLYGTAVNKVQADVDAYSNLIYNNHPEIAQYNSDAVSAYNVALTDFNQNLTDYKNSSIYSGTSTIETLLNETHNTLKAVNVAINNAKNLLDYVNNTLQQGQQRVPAQLNIDETNLQSYLSTTNNHTSVIFQIQNSLQNDKQSLVTAGLSVAQTQASLSQLQSGPTQISMEQAQLSVTQAQNALNDANQNLAYDFVRAPFDGIITNITAKIGQPVSGVLGTLVGNTQLAQATFNEVDIVNIKLGQKATVTFSALPNTTLTGTVSQIDTLGTVSQGVVSYNVQVGLDVSTSSVKPGMSDDLSIITNVKSDTLLVPNSAIKTQQGNSYAQILGSDGKPQQKQVVKGLANDTMTEILSGLNEGDSVITQTVTNSSTATQTTQTTARTGGGGGLGGVRIPGL